MEEREYKPHYVELSQLKGVCGVYQIRNIVNNCVYIGSSIDMYSRNKYHFRYLKAGKHSNNHLQASFNKYGIDSFVFEVIEFCLREKRFDIEQYWIDKFYHKNCFNQNKFAVQAPYANYKSNSKDLYDGNHNNREVVCIETKQVFKSIMDAARILNAESTKIILVCQGKRLTHKGLHFMYKEDYDNSTEESLQQRLKTRPKMKTTPVVCLENGRFFNSVTEASKFAKVAHILICRVCMGKGLTAGGYHWLYADEYALKTKEEIKIILSKDIEPYGIEVVCVDTKQVFKSMAEAERQTGISQKCIDNTCLGKNKSAGGLRWMYKSDYDKLSDTQKLKLMNTKLETQKRSCVCLETGKIFKSIQDAARKMNLKAVSINAVCAGRFNSIKGWHFKYKEEYDKLSKKKIDEIINWKPPQKKVYCTTNGITYDCLKSAGCFLNLSVKAISAVCRGIRNHTGGYHFKYVD